MEPKFGEIQETTSYTQVVTIHGTVYKLEADTLEEAFSQREEVQARYEEAIAPYADWEPGDLGYFLDAGVIRKVVVHSLYYGSMRCSLMSADAGLNLTSIVGGYRRFHRYAAGSRHTRLERTKEAFFEERK